MAEQPFTPAGVTAKTTELYALSNTALLTQANLIRSNFRTWVKDNFTLDSTQESYLDSLDDKWVAYSACETGFAVENRLPITLVTSAPPSAARASKLVRAESDLTCTSSATTFAAGGSLKFVISYG